jgi:hypothetical protein
MSFPDDKRAVSQVIGALLIFAFLVITFSGYQATIVPDQNAEIEFSHSQQVESDFVGIRNAVLNARDGETQSQQIPLSVRYPSRAIAVNAGPASGSLQTTKLGEYELTGAGTTPADVCRLPSGPVTTQRLSFTPNYNYFDGAPDRFSYGNSVAYRNFSSAKRVDTTQTLVQGSTVRIRPLSGDVQQSRDGAVSVTATAGTTATQQVAAPGSGATLELRVPSDLKPEDWRDQTELDEQDIVTAVTKYPDGIVLELQEDGDGITIACTPVGLDTEPPTQTTPTSTPTPTPTTTTPTTPTSTEPTLQSTSVTDNSETTRSNSQRNAKYDVSYEVDDPDNRFDRVRVTFDRRDGETVTKSASSKPTGSVSYTGPDGSSSPNQGGQEYTITIEVINSNGQVTDTKTYTDTADNNDP